MHLEPVATHSSVYIYTQPLWNHVSKQDATCTQLIKFHRSMLLQTEQVLNQCSPHTIKHSRWPGIYGGITSTMLHCFVPVWVLNLPTSLTWDGVRFAQDVLENALAIKFEEVCSGEHPQPGRRSRRKRHAYSARSRFREIRFERQYMQQSVAKTQLWSEAEWSVSIRVNSWRNSLPKLIHKFIK